MLTVHVSPSGSGAIEVSGEVVLVDEAYEYSNDTNVNLKAVPQDGYRFAYWTGSISGSENPVAVYIHGTKDITAHFIQVATLSTTTGKELKAAAIEGSDLSLKAVDPASLPAGAKRPETLPYGLIDISVEAGSDGRAMVRFFLPEPLPEDGSWYKYSDTAGWIDFSRDAISGTEGEGAEFNSARTEVTVYLVDNGPYDDDPAEGMIRDPSGPGMAIDDSPGAPDDDETPDEPVDETSSRSDDDGGGCFIGAM